MRSISTDVSVSRTPDSARTTVTTTTSKLWPRTVQEEEIWSSGLPWRQKLILLCYAFDAQDGEPTQLTLQRLQERTRLGRTTLIKHLQALVAAGWLVPERATT